MAQNRTIITTIDVSACEGQEDSKQRKRDAVDDFPDMKIHVLKFGNVPKIPLLAKRPKFHYFSKIVKFSVGAFYFEKVPD